MIIASFFIIAHIAGCPFMQHNTLHRAVRFQTDVKLYSLMSLANESI